MYFKKYREGKKKFNDVKDILIKMKQKYLIYI